MCRLGPRCSSIPWCPWVGLAFLFRKFQESCRQLSLATTSALLLRWLTLEVPASIAVHSAFDVAWSASEQGWQARSEARSGPPPSVAYCVLTPFVVSARTPSLLLLLLMWCFLRFPSVLLVYLVFSCKSSLSS